MRTTPCWAITQRVTVIPSRRFGTTCGSHRDSWPLNMIPIVRPETSRNYHYALHNSPEERSSQGYCFLLRLTAAQWVGVYVMKLLFCNFHITLFDLCEAKHARETNFLFLCFDFIHWTPFHLYAIIEKFSVTSARVCNEGVLISERIWDPLNIYIYCSL